MSRKSAPWFKCFPEDWLEDTRLLSLAQRGAYFDVLCLLYGSDGKLTDNDSLIAHKLHVHIKTWRAIRKVLISASLLTVEGKSLTNKRAMKIVKERHEKREALSRNSNVRWNKEPKKSENADKTSTSAIQLHPKDDPNAVQLLTDREIERKKEEKKTPIIPLGLGAKITDDGILLDAQERADWLMRFGGDAGRLDLALTQAAAYVQENSRRPVLVQVRAQLARHLADKKDRDDRYGAGKPKPASMAAFSGCSVRDTSESFAEYQARMIREGKFKPMPLAAKE